MQISQLPASSSFSGSDVIAIEINGVTYKLTGSTLATALRTIGGALPVANGGTGATSAADAAQNLGQGVELALAGGATSITLTNTTGSIQILDSAYFDQYRFIDFYFGFQSGFIQCQRFWADGYKTYKGGFFAYNQSDAHVRGVSYAFTTNGRYIENVNVLVSYNNEAWAQNNNSLILYKVFGYK